MNEIIADYEVLRGMAGEVKYFINPCPFGMAAIGGGTAMVGSSSCQMCPYFGGMVFVSDEGDIVKCNH